MGLHTRREPPNALSAKMVARQALLVVAAVWLEQSLAAPTRSTSFSADGDASQLTATATTRNSAPTSASRPLGAPQHHGVSQQWNQPEKFSGDSSGKVTETSRSAAPDNLPTRLLPDVLRSGSLREGDLALVLRDGRLDSSEYRGEEGENGIPGTAALSARKASKEDESRHRQHERRSRKLRGFLRGPSDRRRPNTDERAAEWSGVRGSNAGLSSSLSGERATTKTTPDAERLSSNRGSGQGPTSDGREPQAIWDPRKEESVNQRPSAGQEGLPAPPQRVVNAEKWGAGGGRGYGSWSIRAAWWRRRLQHRDEEDETVDDDDAQDDSFGSVGLLAFLVCFALMFCVMEVAKCYCLLECRRRQRTRRTRERNAETNPAVRLPVVTSRPVAPSVPEAGSKEGWVEVIIDGVALSVGASNDDTVLDAASLILTPPSPYENVHTGGSDSAEIPDNETEMPSARGYPVADASHALQEAVEHAQRLSPRNGVRASGIPPPPAGPPRPNLARSLNQSAPNLRSLLASPAGRVVTARTPGGRRDADADGRGETVLPATAEVPT